jgi:hypothetical protein
MSTDTDSIAFVHHAGGSAFKKYTYYTWRVEREFNLVLYADSADPDCRMKCFPQGEDDQQKKR